MTNKNASAFPVIEPYNSINIDAGLTKREYIAAKILAALVSNEAAMVDLLKVAGDIKSAQKLAIKSAVNAADGLLEALK